MFVCSGDSLIDLSIVGIGENAKQYNEAGNESNLQCQVGTTGVVILGYKCR